MAINEATLINAATHAGLFTIEAVNQARKIARRDRLQVLDALGREHRLPRTSLYQAVAEQRNLPFLPLAKLQPDHELLARLPANLLQRRLVLPVRNRQNQLLLAMADPDDQVAIDTVKRVINMPFKVALAEPVSLISILKCELNEVPNEEQDPVKLFDDLMKEAYVCNASDIHLKPEKGGLKASLRVDGRLIPYPKLLNTQEASLLVNRVKVLSSLDISEQRIPQDGGFSYQISDWNLPPQDLRVATLPSRWGERITLRILGQESGALALDQLDLNPAVLERLRNVLTYPHGMVLVTGPTGSGKSTTLYASLREIDRTEFNVLTVEDPIEQLLADTTQVQVGIKVSFAQALRSFLRHDPDIILVGEIRDQDTAETAMKAAMTGHLVLATLHTNNATSAMGRLRNLNCEDFMIASTVRLVIAQRLARRLCRLCRRPADSPPPPEFKILNDAQLYEPRGCPACLGTGYKGRIGLHEMFWVDSEITQLIAAGANDNELRLAATDRLYTLWQDALYKVASGETSLAEVLPFRDDLHEEQSQIESLKDNSATNSLDNAEVLI
jgi:type II secretory ATPase GspE/PulE/Tfp pilus assembly ATPase PilB-like protein